MLDSVKKFDNVVDNRFLEFMGYAYHSELENIKGFMKSNLEKIRQHDRQSYEGIISCYNTYKYWGKIDLDKNIYELIDNRAIAMKEHYNDFLWLYERLCDNRSKKTLYGVLENWLFFSRLSLGSIMEKTFRHYFDLDIMKCDENEVLVDIGAYIGDTVYDYLATYSGYKKIYCYEIVPQIFKKLTESLESYPNIEFRQKGVADKEGVMYITDDEPSDSMHKLSNSGSLEIPVVTIDKDITEPVTFIKMDIEGGEQNAILGCREHIKANHPKLAISVYHNNEDIWKCARMIDEIDSSYKFYMRYSGGDYYPSEYVLLAI